MAALNIEHVVNTEGQLLEEINLVRRMTKGEKQRHVYLTHPKVGKALLAYVEERRQEDGLAFSLQAPLFRSQHGGRFSPNSLQQVFIASISKQGWSERARIQADVPLPPA